MGFKAKQLHYREVRRKSGTSSLRHTWYVLAGVLMGYMAGNVIRIAVDRCRGQILPVHNIGKFMPTLDVFREKVEHSNTNKFYTDKNLVLVAVMTTKEFLKTRAVSIRDTWAKSIPGDVIFFSSEGSENLAHPGMKVVGLKGVRDVYPPQKKAFMMLKYIHDHYLDKFRFFLRADDDIYIKGEELLKLLHSINSTGVSVIGSPGFGNKAEFGKLNLGDDANYCMGGPGMIMTREILAKTVPHIKYCLKNIYTTHEDVEVGRCIKRYANVQCVWSTTPNLFYQNYKEPKGSFTHSLWSAGIQKAVTLHPVKLPSYVYRLHQNLLTLKVSSLGRRVWSLQREIDAMDSLLQDTDRTKNLFTEITVPTNGLTQRTDDGVSDWDFVYEHLYSTRSGLPKAHLPSGAKSVMADIKEQTWTVMNPIALDEGRKLRRRNVKVLYSRVSQMHGHDYILQLITRPLHLPLQNQSTKDVRYQTVLAHRSFLDLESDDDFRVNDGYHTNTQNTPVVKRPSAGNDKPRQGSLGSRNKVEIDIDNKCQSFIICQPRVNFILPLSGRYSMFLKFLQKFEDVFLKTNENVSLTIMLFRNDPNDTSVDVMNYVTRLKQTYNDSSLSVVLMNGNFSRGVALQNGSRRFQGGDLLFFADVDLELEPSTLLRIRLNTVKGQTIYAPILFSHYDPQYLPSDISKEYSKDIGEKFGLDRGYWRSYGFGMISTYKSDLDRAGGFRQDIKRWGLEDVDLLEKFISANVTVFRSVDVGLLHRFHPITCDHILTKTQYNMCIGTKYTTFASLSRMAEIVYHTQEIFNRGKAVRPAIKLKSRLAKGNALKV